MEYKRSTNIQVACALGSIAASMLASDTSLKCVVDDKETSINHCVAHILQNIDVQHPMGYIINSCIEDHHSRHRNGTKSLLAMTGFLCQHLEALVEEGVPLSDVISFSHDALHLCITSLHQCSLPLSAFYDENKRDDVTQQPGNHVKGNDQDSDDIGWFFDGGRVPTPPSFPVDVVASCGNKINSIALLNNSGFDQRSEGTATTIYNSDMKNVCHAIDEIQQTFTGDSVAVGDAANDSDFDDCFEDVNFVEQMTPQSVIRKTNSILIGDSVPVTMVSGLEELVSEDLPLTATASGLHTGSVDLSKGDVMETRTLSSNNTDHLKETSSLRNQQLSCDWLNASAIQNKSSLASKTNCRMSTKSLRPSCDVEEKLKRILIEKSRTLNQCVVNRSRHFRTIDSSVQELAGSGDKKHVSCGDEISHVTLNDGYVSLSASGGVNRSVVNDNNGTNLRMAVESSRLFGLFATNVSDPLSFINRKIADDQCRSLPDKDPVTENRHLKSDNSGDGLEMTNDSNAGLRHLVCGLCRGSAEICDVLLQLLLKQNELHGVLRLDLSRTHTSCCSGPLVDKPEIISGILLSAPCSRLLNLSPGNKRYRCLLINGDVIRDFHHTGFVAKKNLTMTLDCVPEISESESWLRDVASLLKELQVSAVLTTGSADPVFLDICDNESIVVLTSVPFRALQCVAENSSAQLTVYVTEASQENIANDVCIRPWRSDWMDQSGPRMHYVIVEPRNTPVQSLLFTHHITNFAKHKQEQFWHCAHRLQHSLVASMVLPGSGFTELHCAERLRSEAEILLTGEHRDNLFRVRVYESFAAAFESFAQVVQKNCGIATPTRSLPNDTVNLTDTVIYDDYLSKIESLRAAVYLVGIVLRTSTEIITGLDENFLKQHQHNLCVL